RREGRYCASRLRVRSTEHAPGCASPGAKHHRNWRLRSHRASPDRTDVHARTERGTLRPTTVRLSPSSQPRDQDFPLEDHFLRQIPGELAEQFLLAEDLRFELLHVHRLDRLERLVFDAQPVQVD